MKISAIKIEDRGRDDLGDIDALAASIADVGLLHPVVVDAANILIAGERRLEACKKLGWKEVAVTVATEIDGVARAIRAERDENVCRKDFTPTEAARLAKRLEPLEKKAAGERQEKLNGKSKGDASGNFPQARGRAADKVAEAVGMSRPTLEKAKAVVEAAREHPDHYEDIREEMDKTGKVDPAYRKLAARQDEPERPRVKLPRAVPTWQWAKAFQTLYEMFNIIKKRGGIEPVMNEWEPHELKDYHRILKDVQKRCGEYLPELEKRLSCGK